MRSLGIERELFIIQNGHIVPKIGELLPKLQEMAEKIGLSKNQFGFELFAGQVEDRTKIVQNINDLIQSLRENRRLLEIVGKQLNLNFMCKDYVDEEDLGELIVNPFDKRHQKIWLTLDKKRKIAASQVAAIHVHISVTGEEAVKVLNICRKKEIDRLAKLGDFSQGKRLRAYRIMAQVYGDPPEFNNLNELMAYITNKGGERNVWDMVRYKPSTRTIEFRMFGSTDKEDKIISFIKACQEIIKRAC